METVSNSLTAPGTILSGSWSPIPAVPRGWPTAMGLCRSVHHEAHWTFWRQSSHQLPCQQWTSGAGPYGMCRQWGTHSHWLQTGESLSKTWHRRPCRESGTEANSEVALICSKRDQGWGSWGFISSSGVPGLSLPMAHTLTHTFLTCSQAPWLLICAMYSSSHSHATLQLQHPSTRSLLSPALPGSLSATRLSQETISVVPCLPFQGPSTLPWAALDKEPIFILFLELGWLLDCRERTWVPFVLWGRTRICRSLVALTVCTAALGSALRAAGMLGWAHSCGKESQQILTAQP